MAPSKKKQSEKKINLTALIEKKRLGLNDLTIIRSMFNTLN